MGLIDRELARLAKALREPRSEDEYRQLYAAQTALAWARDPAYFGAPAAAITGKSEDSTDYPARLCPAQSLYSDGQTC